MKNQLKKEPEAQSNFRKRVFFTFFKLFLLLLIASASSNVSAIANLSVLQEVKLSIKQNNVPLSKVITQIEKETGYSVLIRLNDIDENEKITVNLTNASLNQILDAVFKGKNVKYEISGKTISVFRPATVATVNQQENTIPEVKGVVLEKSTNEPLIGVSVKVKGSPVIGDVTDMLGSYSLKDVPKNAVLEFTYIGMISQSISVGNKAKIDVVMDEDKLNLDEVVVIGYTGVKKGLLTGSVVSMNINEEMKELPVTSAGNLMIGRLSGVNVSTVNGVPGSNPSIKIRTSSSFSNSGDQPVTYVIDGVIRGSGDFNNLSPNEIETITVLKDAASAAIYGSRSAGGVILVTTKRGKAGKPVFNYSYSYGIDKRTPNADLTSAVQAGELYNRINGDSDPAGWRWSQEELDHFAKNVNNGWGYDQLETVWKDPNVQAHNLSVSGGADKVRYFSAFSYIKEESFLKPLTYDKMNFRLNATIDLSKHLEFFAGMGLSLNNKGNITFEGTDLYTKLLRWQPDQAVFTDSGQPIDYGWIANVGAEVNGEGGYNKNRFLKPQIVTNMTYKVPFVEGLSAKVAYASNWAVNLDREFRKNYDLMKMQREGLNNRIIHTDDASIVGIRKSTHNGKEYISRKMTWGQDYQLNLQLNYNNTFNKVHQVQGALVFEKTQSSGTGVNARRETFPVYLTDQFWAASNARTDTDGNGDTDWTNGRISYIGQFNYSYANKYLLNFSFREDGSMQFAPDERWGFFPAGSVGWVISEENFFKKETINFLKLRASVGLTGGDYVASGWQWQETYKSGNPAYFGTNPSKLQGLTYGSVVNPKLTWEKSLSYDVGVEMHFLKHWNTTVDYWYKNTYDILGPREASVPTSYSMKLPDENYGKMNSQGIDLNLGYRNSTGDFEYYADLTASYGWNKVIKKDYAQNAKWIDIPEGKAFDSDRITGYRFDQILKTQEQLDKFKQEHPNYKHNGLTPELGMMVYKDLNGPGGKPDGIIDSWDKDLLVAKNFPVIYGLNLGGSWKGISVDLLFNGKFKQWKSFKDLAGGVEWNRMWSEWYDNSWTPENPDAWLPKRKSNNVSKTYEDTNSEFWLKEVNFMRLKYINVGYTIPQKFYGKVFDRVKIFFTGTNLFMLDNFSYYDPEIGGGMNFPVMRTYSFGIDVKF